MAEIIELPYSQCERLLRSGTFGRIALNRHTGPEIVPVNYIVDGDTVVVRTSHGSLLDRHAPGSAVVFEIDGVDHRAAHGWSVTARGWGERVGADELASLRRASGFSSWASLKDETLIRVRWVTLTGRRLGTGWSPVGDQLAERRRR